MGLSRPQRSMVQRELAQAEPVRPPPSRKGAWRREAVVLSRGGACRVQVGRHGVVCTPGSLHQSGVGEGMCDMVALAGSVSVRRGTSATGSE